MTSQTFFEELDAFVDDATSRRLGNGAQYYGKRKSSFYGKDDSNRKRDKVRAEGGGGVASRSEYLYVSRRVSRITLKITEVPAMQDISNGSLMRMAR